MGVGVVFTQVLSPSDQLIWESLYREWTREWKPSQESPKEAIAQVLSFVREDKRKDLNLALKLLGIAPLCFYLTGYFSPWANPEAVKKIIERWQFSEKEMEKKLYGAFASIINSAFYGDSQSWSAIGYPGAPEFYRLKGTL